MSNIQFLTHQSRAERIHDNLEQLLDPPLTSITVANAGLTPNPLPPVVDVSSRADKVNKLVNLYLSFTVGLGTVGPVPLYTINNSAFFPQSSVVGVGADALGQGLAISVSTTGLVSLTNPVVPDPSPSISYANVSYFTN